MKRHFAPRALVVLLILAFALVAVPPATAAPDAPDAAISLTGSYSQNFDTLANSGTSSTVPAGWAFSETGSNANTTYTGGTGSSNTGDTYSFGATSTTERAFGGLRSNNLVPTIGAEFSNGAGTAVISLAVSYNCEQWRLGTTGRTDRMDFQYSLNATSLSTGTWVDVDALDCSGTVSTGTAGALDGNTNRTAVSGSVTSLSIASGAGFWIRWNDVDVTSADDGLGVDDFSLTPTFAVGDTAPSVTSTTPTSGATGVALATDIAVTFSEPVTVSGTWYSISCSDSGAHTAVVSGGSTIFTLNPNADFTVGETCTVTIVGAQVTDQDGTPDAMAANYVWSFDTVAPSTTCGDAANHIHAIQGSDISSPVPGKAKTIEGIVIGDYETTGRKGYFVQEEDADADGNTATSEGIFVYDANTTSEVSLGDKVRVTGTVTEFSGLTELGTITSQIVCSSGQGGLVTATPVSLPAASSTALEPFEGMKVSFAQALTVTDNYDLGRYGQLTLSENGKLWQYTHLNPPSVSGYAAHLNTVALRSIILDDGDTAQNLDPYYPGTGLTALNTVRVGDTVTGLTAVLDQYTAYQLQPIGQVAFTAANPRPTAPPAVGGNVKVGAFNTLNFFVTIGTTACGPTGGQDCRGADNADEFTRQRAKLVAAICGLNADVLGLMELENPYSGNDPFPGDGISDYVLQNLVTALNASAACPDDYAFTDNTAAGTDAIRQGLIYKPTIVTPVGATAILQSTAFINGGDSTARNRPALTQAFEVVDGGERFIVSVNHLKSKGSACDTADANDGQGNCAVVRTNAANALTAWLATDPTGAGDPDTLIMGDLNSYAKEDPITALVNAGYTDLINWTVGSAGYSYGFDGMMGYLDHALGSSALLAQTLAANEWHINADEPDVLDYDTQYKTPAQMISLYNADPYRSTDHDPVLVGLGLYPDLSDLASGYGVAWHTGQGNPWRLGAGWTGDPTSGTGTDADDGVMRDYAESWNDGRGEVNVTVTGPAGQWACLNAWLDYSDGSATAGTMETPDGAFNAANEHVVNNRPIQPGASQVTWPLEQGVINSAATYNMRFRLTPAPNPAVADCSGVTLAAAAAPLAPDGGAQPTGRADGGEVEDYGFNPGPLAATLASFTAATTAEGVALAWETVSETDNAGFNLYRADTEAGPWAQVNAALIPAATPGASGGHAYTWTDATALPNTAYVYRLEAVALDGSAEVLETLGVTYRPAQRRWLPLLSMPR